MRRRLSVFIIAFIFFAVSMPVLACDENQTNTYVAQIIFGDSASYRTTNKDVKKLLSALYLCSEQSNHSGQEKIDYLSKQRVSGIPSLSKIDIKDKDLMACAHKSWEDMSSNVEKAQAKRKKLLKKTVNDVFDFGFFGNLFGSGNGKCNSFAALLYYSHILSDYLADDPEVTKTAVNGKLVSSYSGQAFTTVNGNKPSFTKEQKANTQSTAKLSQLDSQGRAGVALANVGPDIMPPSGSRQEIGMIKPSGWKQGKYKEIIGTETNPGFLYNRCHLIAHQLIGEDGETNLITGTRYLNETGMKPFEEKVAAYINKTGNHVLYRATPIFKGDNKLASGVQLEAYSIEDAGEGICFNVYCYNVQPGIEINYSTGENEASDQTAGSKEIIPFAISGANASNPDLILEMNKHLEILFEDQKSSRTYSSMEGEIRTLANRARAAEKNHKNEAQRYIELKNYEYEYLDILKTYVPRLLKKEDFFKSTFK